MKQDGTKPGNFVWGAIFFVSGGLVHLVLLRLYVHWAYLPTQDTSFVNHPLTNITLPLLGGMSVASFLLLLRGRLLERKSLDAPLVMLKGGLYGVAGTTLALMLFYILSSLYLAFWGSSEHPSVTSSLTFVFYLVGISTYGIEPVLRSIPYSFAYGAAAAALILVVLRKEKRWSPWAETLRSMAALSLTLAVIGLLSFAILVTSAVFDALAVTVGWRALRQIQRTGAGGKGLATAGVILGGLGLLLIGAYLARR